MKKAITEQGFTYIKRLQNVKEYTQTTIVKMVPFSRKDVRMAMKTETWPAFRKKQAAALRERLERQNQAAAESELLESIDMTTDNVQQEDPSDPYYPLETGFSRGYLTPEQKERRKYERRRTWSIGIIAYAALIACTLVIYYYSK